MHPYDERLARFFMLPADELAQPPFAWGDALVEAIMTDATPGRVAEEFVAEHYRLVLAPRLTPDLEDFNPNADPSAEMVVATQRAMADWSAEVRQRCEVATRHLAVLLQSDDPTVRRATRYAIASHPAFVLALEHDLVRLLAQPSSAVRAEAVALVAMTQHGAFPALDAAIEHLDVPSATERAILRAAMRAAR